MLRSKFTKSLPFLIKIFSSNFTSLFYPNHTKSHLKKYRRIIYHGTEDSDKKFKGKLTCGFKYDMRNLVTFYTATHKSEIFTSIGSFCRRYIKFELKKYRGVIFYDIEQNSDAKFE